MKNFYGAQYLLIGLSVISFSLSGMEKEKAILRIGDGQMVEIQQPTHIITFQPCGGYIEVTEENRNKFTQYFEQHGITLNSPLTKVIAVKETQQTNKNNKAIQICSNEYIKEVPLLLPLDLFIRKQDPVTIECKSDKNTIRLLAQAPRHENSFVAHATLLDKPIKSTNKKESPEKYAQDLQQQLNDNAIPALQFLAQLAPQQEIEPELEVSKKDLPADAIESFVSTLINASYEQQLTMIDGVNENQHQEILACFLKNKNLGEMLADKYNTLKTSADLGDQSETDRELKLAAAALCDQNITLNNALCVYSILRQEDLTSSTAIDLLPSPIKTIVNSCRTFKKVIGCKEELQKQKESANSISITREVALLSSVIKDMIADFADDKQQTGNINYRVPSCIQKPIMEQLAALLDRCLTLNCSDLENETKTIEEAIKTLQGDINKLNLETVTQLLRAAHYLDIVKEAPNDKQVIKPIILKPSLLSAFTNKLINETYENRNKIISTLDADLLNDCLHTIENLCLKLQDDLVRKYNYKTQTACIQNHPGVVRQVKTVGEVVPKAISWKEGDIVHINCSLSQILFIKDIFENKPYTKEIVITDESISTPVKIVLDACNYFDEEIKKAEEGKRLRDEHAQRLYAEQQAERAEAARIKKEKDDAQERWNKSFQGRIYNNIARFTAHCKANPFNLILPTYIAFAAGYCYYFRDRIATGLANDYTRLTDFLTRLTDSLKRA